MASQVYKVQQLQLILLKCLSLSESPNERFFLQPNVKTDIGGAQTESSIHTLGLNITQEQDGSGRTAGASDCSVAKPSKWVRLQRVTLAPQVFSLSLTWFRWTQVSTAALGWLHLR